MIVVERATGPCTIQDLGRPGRMHEGLAPGGALVPALLIAANRAVGNPDGAAAIEVQGQLVVRGDRELVVSTTGVLGVSGEMVWTLASDPWRVAYLAVRGGIDVPIVLGSRATQLSAGLGRMLCRGDVLPTSGAPSAPVRRSTDSLIEGTVNDLPIGIEPGPDRAAFPDGELARLLGGSYRIAPTSDRVGTRLVGRALSRLHRAEVTAPMVIGAIEVPGDGMPIVLGPEHPTTGGYPVIAVVRSADLGRFFATRLGGVITFTFA